MTDHSASTLTGSTAGATLDPPSAALAGVLAGLERVLTAQAEAHERLAALLEDERRALARLDAAAVQRCAERKAEIAQHIAETEAERQRLIPAIQAHLTPGSAPALRLADLIAALPAAQRPRFAALRERLLHSLTALIEGQGRNRSLAEHFFSLLARSMEAVQSAVAALPLYTPAARVGQARWRGCVLNQRA